MNSTERVAAEQAKADAEAKTMAIVTGSVSATVIREWPGGSVTGRYQRPATA